MVAVVSLSEDNREDLIGSCKGISELIHWLDALNNRPGLQELGTRLESSSINLASLKKFIGYDETGSYQRNIIKKTEHYEMVAITWRPGCDTPIHNHQGSDCAFLIVEGVCTETIYALNDEGKASPEMQREYVVGGVCAADEPDIHRISNDTDSNLINLHVYSPPLRNFKTFESA
ncbi:MAG: hypothetical protein CMB37_01725 [Euryarchaeota archaeon]|jgi:cysteine dioxygenase|nr:hypothetical protein [Euryarchaeota archaeon]MEC7704499.1 cysteine dioxygenase family protein [Candidatus Thermoplasmatota archaeon]MED5486732.1 cysteine dioxygenase family protein [Candidatus Thermoplasmatota archaeon]|tara:strand:+ start:2789 stop:3313 length:525 start_codon:yes stop_codon:yes gene_type:complete